MSARAKGSRPAGGRSRIPGSETARKSWRPTTNPPGDAKQPDQAARRREVLRATRVVVLRPSSEVTAERGLPNLDLVIHDRRLKRRLDFHRRHGGLTSLLLAVERAAPPPNLHAAFVD